MFDFGGIMARKQERECARLDDFAFRVKARTIKLAAASVKNRANDPSAIDPVRYAGEIALRPMHEILSELRTALSEPLDDRAWDRFIALCEQDAQRSLTAERGDPSPHRLA